MCLYPNRVFYTGKINENGKKDTVFSSRFTTYLYRRSPSDRWIPGSVGTPASARANGYQVLDDYDDVPCGQCIECRLNYARMWSCRIMNEVELYPENTCWFVTCTYNDKHLPKAHPIIKVDDDGVITTRVSEFNSLSKTDHQQFIKRLRKHFDKKSDMKIRYFMSGEYGDESLRPHFHYILFGVYLDDLRLYKITPSGDKLYTSKCLQDIWDSPLGEERGFVTIGAVTPDSASYIARYAIKKRKMKGSDFYEDMGIDPEFLCMSRRPGIGKEWFEKHKSEIYELDKITLSGRDGAFVVNPPRYYDCLLASENMDQFEAIKDKRKTMAELQQQTFEHLHPFMDREVINEAKERNYLKQIGMLRSRNVIHKNNVNDLFK